MKRILFVAFATTLLAASCSKTEVINPEGNQIGFSTKMAKLTKASGDAADAESVGLANLQAQDFRIWAYADFEDPYTNELELDDIYDGMEGLNIAYNKDTDKWAPAIDYYWPGKDKALRFFAVSGEQSSTVSVAINRTTTGEGASAVTTVAPTVTISDYVVNHENPNTDLMIADFVLQDQDDVIGERSKGVVALSFHHALTKVEFLFKTNTTASDGAVYVQSVTVEGLNTKSTLVVDDEGASLAEKFVWGTRSVPEPFTDDYTSTGEGFPTSLLHINETVEKEPTDKTAMLLDGDAKPFCTWLALPQNIEANKVKIVYVIGTRQFERSFELSNGNLNEWGVNQYVRYTVTLTPNKIAFDSSVEDWSKTDVAEKEL